MLEVLKDVYNLNTSLKLTKFCQRLGRGTVPISKWERCWNQSQETWVWGSLLLLRADNTHIVHLEHQWVDRICPVTSNILCFCVSQFGRWVGVVEERKYFDNDVIATY